MLRTFSALLIVQSESLKPDTLLTSALRLRAWSVELWRFRPFLLPWCSCSTACARLARMSLFSLLFRAYRASEIADPHASLTRTLDELGSWCTREGVADSWNGFQEYLFKSLQHNDPSSFTIPQWFAVSGLKTRWSTCCKTCWNVCRSPPRAHTRTAPIPSKGGRVSQSLS